MTEMAEIKNKNTEIMIEIIGIITERAEIMTGLSKIITGWL